MAYVEVRGYGRGQVGCFGDVRPGVDEQFWTAWNALRVRLFEAAKKLSQGTAEERVWHTTLLTTTMSRLDSSAAKIAAGDRTLLPNFQAAVRGVFDALRHAEPTKVQLMQKAWDESVQEFAKGSGGVINTVAGGIWANLSPGVKAAGVMAGAFVFWRLVR